MEDRAIDFCRIKELEIGDRFLYMGIWKIVVSIQDGLLTHKDSFPTHMNANYQRRKISANSMQFVEVIKAKSPSNHLIKLK